MTELLPQPRTPMPVDGGADRDGLRLPRLIGHRGAAAVAPENTIVSIRKAQQLGAAWVEFDVKLTREGVPILMHDDRLERTTSGRGCVADHTLAAIRELDAGGWFAPAFDGESVPTFEEALATCAELGLGINLEIKPCPGRNEETAHAVLDVLEANWTADLSPLLISSFAHACLAVARERAPDVPRGYLCSRLPRDWAAELEHYGCVTLHTDHRRIRGAQLAELRAAGVPVLLYTVNDPRRVRKLLELGVTAVFTDRIGEALDGLS
jgi:glycerophosphoryl diester phosphodiesterase